MIAALGSFFPGLISLLIIGVFAVAILAMNALFLFKATKHGCFAAVTPKGIVVKNRSGEHWIALEDISMFSKYDPTPWLKKKGIDRTISLGNLFDARSELAEFEQAIFKIDPKDSSPNQTDRKANDEKQPKNQDAPPAQRKSNSRSRKTRKQGPAAILTPIGVILIGIGIVSMPILAMLLSSDLKRTILSAGVGVFWFGVALALIGQWHSDPKSRKQNKQT